MGSFSSFFDERTSFIIALVLGGTYLTYVLIQRAIIGHHRSIIIQTNNCKPVPKYPHKEPIFGLDLFIENTKLSKTGGYLERVQERYRENGVYTFSQLILGERIINTAEPENVKTILATKFKDFKLTQRRKDAIGPVFGHGIFVTDGEEWAASRALLRPSFSRSFIGDLDVFEDHISNMMSKIPRDGSTVDLQSLFFKLTLDTCTSSSLLTLARH
jgi:hypothetical protein